MGTLVFQATLGGAINLIGPNTASTVNFTLPSADGSSGQALSTNGSGVLSFGTLAVGAGGTGQTSYTNGQLLIGNSTGNTLTKATLTAGTNVTITNSAGAITIAASGGGASAATPTALGTVYGKTDTSSLAFLGYQAGNSNTGTNNVFVGYQAGYTNSSGQYSVMVGQGAGYSIASNTITCVGALAGYSTTGNQNQFFGNVAGYDVTTGSNNTILGGYTGNGDGLDIRTASNYVVIADGVGNRQITMKEGQTLALDSAVPNAGTGITFPATQSASSDANTLDDYEEGTYTLSLGGTSTTSINAGIYTKVGRMVHCMGLISVTTLGTGSATTITGGLPFNPSNAGGGNSGGSVSYYSGLAVNVIAISPYLIQGSTSLAFSGSAAASAGSSGLAIFGNGARIDYTAVYST